MRRFRSLPVFAMMILLCAQGAFAGLAEYVQRPDASYAYEIVETKPLGTSTAEVIKLTSQTWQGIVWQHWLVIVRPQEVAHPETALLLIDGGSVRDKAPALDNRETQIVALVAAQTKSVVAAITQVPNEPLFDGRSEDEIIAYTYDKFLKGEGEDWPLLFPMCKSAVRAMDTVQKVAREKHRQEIKGFVLTGGSKRGWTSWLTAASGDARVKAIAPVVIDVLNMEPQMKRQMQVYGGYSEQVEDYSKLQIQERMSSPEGKKLLSLVDPYSYRDRLVMPKLMILGTNDPYWTVDAANLYFPDLKGPKYLYYQANIGHDVSLDGVAVLSQFYNATAAGKPFPEVAWKSDDKGNLEVTWDRQDGKAVLWQTTSPNRDFRKSTWTSNTIEGAGKANVHMTAPEQGWLAFYVEVRFPGDFGFDFGSCTQMTVVPDTFPTEGRTYDLQKRAQQAGK